MDVCDAIASLEAGGPLQKLIATVDLSIRCSSEVTEEVKGMAVQVACSPKLEREADELERNGDGDAAAKRREDRRLATVASDVGAFKSSNPQATVATNFCSGPPVSRPATPSQTSTRRRPQYTDSTLRSRKAPPSFGKLGR